MKAIPTCAFLLAAFLAAHPVHGDDEQIPQYPDEQQDMLRSADEETVQIQRALFAARQQGDKATAEKLTEQLNKLRTKRRALIKATQDRMPIN